MELSLIWGELGKECCNNTPKMDIRVGISISIDCPYCLFIAIVFLWLCLLLGFSPQRD